MKLLLLSRASLAGRNQFFFRQGRVKVLVTMSWRFAQRKFVIPIPENIPEGTQVEKTPVFISNLRNYSRFTQPSKRNVIVQRNYSNNNLIYIPCQTLESSNRFSHNKVIVGQSHCIKISHLNMRSLKIREHFLQVADLINNGDFDIFTA